MTKYDLRKEYTDKVSKKMSEVGRHQIDPTPTNTSLDNLLKIIQKIYLRGRYVEQGLVADNFEQEQHQYVKDIEAYTAAQVQQGKIDALQHLEAAREDAKGADLFISEYITKFALQSQAEGSDLVAPQPLDDTDTANPPKVQTREEQV